MLRDDIVREARRWIGTPFHHQARALGEGVDCAQMALAVAVALGACEDPGVEWQRYGRIPRPEMMRERMASVLIEIPVDQAGPGDIVWIWIRAGVPMHLGVLSPIGIIHAYADAGRVVETRIGDDLRRRIRSAWRFPQLEDV